MKKLFFFGGFVTIFFSCSLDDSVIEDFNFEILPIEDVVIPNEMSFGSVYTISYTYLKPTTCHFFNDLYYIEENNIKTFAVINKVLNNNENVICEPLTNEMVEMSFIFVVNKNEGNYIFKFWQGEDENGQENYLVYDVPIVQ